VNDGDQVRCLWRCGDRHGFCGRMVIRYNSCGVWSPGIVRAQVW
jgi:hypothetical protein